MMRHWKVQGWVPLLSCVSGLPYTDPLELLPKAGELRVSRVIIEIGLGTFPSYFDRLEHDESLLLIGCEPNPDALPQLPRHERFILLPVAVGKARYTPGKPLRRVPLHRAATPECSSLLKPVNNDTCAATLSTVIVPILPLSALLERANSLGTIELLEIDAQGTDMDVFESGGRFVHSIARAVLEVQDEQRRHLLEYSKQLFKKGVIDRMSQIGFKKERCWLPNYLHENCAFVPQMTTTYFRDDCWSQDVIDAMKHQMLTAGVYGEFSPALLEELCCETQGRFQEYDHVDEVACWSPPLYTPDSCCLKTYFAQSKLALT
eukprot:TRINITY_DN107458_c0_g1_i1.p1 TRINITY_DN107458_c0_g1~~TRINITY_DN107458_c0_g1_i1.p1  ORF type:complete len:319 (-),score=49.42 TRINITY_DN107458_c0_g1_i1:43-999(-)